MNLVPLHDASPLLHNTPALRARADAEGFLFFAGLIPPDTIAPLRQKVRSCCLDLGLAQETPDDISSRISATPNAKLDGMGHTDSRWLQLQQWMIPSAEFRALRTHPNTLDILKRLYGRTPTPTHGDICRLSMPNSPHQSTQPHQDHFYIGGSPDLWTLWFPLVDSPIEQGPLALLPTSHLQGSLPHGANYRGLDIPKETIWTAGHMKPGDVLFFHCLTVHKSLENRSPSWIRASVDFRYRPSDL